jgi:dihydrofolate reductase
MISIIAAIDDKRGLGKDGGLLFRIKDDMKHLRAITDGHPLVMGRKTFDSFPGLLPNRTHIVITRNPEAYDDAKVKPHFAVSSLEEGIEIAKHTDGSDEIFIFGGGQIFKEAIEKDLVNRLYLTIVKGDYDADTFFPDYAAFVKEIEREDKEGEGFAYTFVTLEKA